MRAIPDAAPQFDAEAFLGTWYILVTNYGYWRNRVDPTVTYEPLPDRDGKRAWRDTLRFGARSLFSQNVKPDTLTGVDVEIAPGRFAWRGDGLLHIIKSPWWVLMTDPGGQWAVTYFGRSNVGTAPGMDIYARNPNLDDSTLQGILHDVRQHPFLKTRCNGLYATVHGALALDRFRL